VAGIEIVVASLAFVAVAVSAVTDLKTRKIKNFVTYPAILLGFAVHLVGAGWDGGEGLGLKWSLIGFLVGGLPFLAMNTIDARSFGMGDVKLMAAVGALLGWPMILEIFFYVALLGGVVAVVVLVKKRRFRATVGGMLSKRTDEEAGDEAASEPRSSPLYIPYGVAIAGGTVAVLALEISRKGIF
jgi:prepilin peptidase CpaA